MPSFLSTKYHEDETRFATDHPGAFSQYHKAVCGKLLLLWFQGPLFLHVGKRTLQLCSGGPQFLFVENSDSKIPYLERGGSKDGPGDPLLSDQDRNPGRTGGPF